MRRAAIDPSIRRVEASGFAYPMGVYPIDPASAPIPVPGYTEQFEQADGGEGPGAYLGSAGFDDWEEWPDRFVYDILLHPARVRPLCRALIAMLPGRVYPILDVLGTDAYREIDPHLAYELVGIERFYDGIREWDDWLFEDGLVGFGAMSVEPFFYFFLDEHKIVTVRVELTFKDRIEKLLAAFDLTVVEELKGVDSVEHEHRSVLAASADNPDLLSAEEIVERLRDAWGLQLNIDSTTNVDDDDNELGVTAWQCVVRCSAPLPDSPPSPPTTPTPPTGGPAIVAPEGSESASSPGGAPAEEAPEEMVVYAEVLLSADNLDTAERLATEAIDLLPGAPSEGWDAIEIIKADRVLPEQLDQWLSAPAVPTAASPASDPPSRESRRGSASGSRRKARTNTIRVHDARWLVAPDESLSSSQTPKRPLRDQDR